MFGAGTLIPSKSIIMNDSLHSLDVHWGVVTFGDSVGGSHDYDLTIEGIDLTNNFDIFHNDLTTIGNIGGGDTPEEALDALWVAAHCINWRRNALHIIFLFTDAVFCEITDTTCSQCRSNLTKEECLDTLLNHNIILYPVVQTSLAWSSCVRALPYHYNFWRNAASITGGAIWPLGSRWYDSIPSFAHSLDTIKNIKVAVRNNLPSMVDAIISHERISGMIFLDTVLTDFRAITAGDVETVAFPYIITDTTVKPAFHAIVDFDAGAYIETLLVTIDACGCHEAVIELKRGWNFISLPSDIFSVPISAFETALGNAYLYNPVIGDYEESLFLAPGPGYWILSSEDARVMFGGTPIYDVVIPTYRGWNSLGAGSLPFPSSRGLRSGSPILPMFEYRDADYHPAATIEIGKGYWLLETASGSWQIP